MAGALKSGARRKARKSLIDLYASRSSLRSSTLVSGFFEVARGPSVGCVPPKSLTSIRHSENTPAHHSLMEIVRRWQRGVELDLGEAAAADADGAVLFLQHSFHQQDRRPMQ